MKEGTEILQRLFQIWGTGGNFEIRDFTENDPEIYGW